jgi:hypothetical protein
MKAAGMDYDERMAELEDVTHPRPLAEVLEPMFDVYRDAHPWVAEHQIHPKSVVRDMHERAMDFGDFVRHYQLGRSEGTVLRYLTDAYKALIRTVPMDLKTDELWDIIEWLGEMVRQVDSSLLDEWEQLRSGDTAQDVAAGAPALAGDALDTAPPPVTANRRAFTILVRNAMFQRVEHLAHRRWGDLEELDGDDGWTKERWFQAATPYFDEHGTLGVGPDARNPAMLLIDEQPDRWLVRQILDDPAGERGWSITAEVDLVASNAEGTAVVTVTGFGET